MPDFMSVKRARIILLLFVAASLFACKQDKETVSKRNWAEPGVPAQLVAERESLNSNYDQLEDLLRRKPMATTEAEKKDISDYLQAIDNYASYRASENAKQGKKYMAAAYHELAIVAAEAEYGDHIYVAIGYNNLANAYDEIDLPDKAIVSYQKALKVYEKLVNEEKNELITLKNAIALCKRENRETEFISLQERKRILLEKMSGSGK
ncbi:MAG: tetratricopeptide repeat protein [Thioalkalispiraceae bacterium]|jgi:tetratricopeptide (TPR) repeat protein